MDINGHTLHTWASNQWTGSLTVDNKRVLWLKINPFPLLWPVDTYPFRLIVRTFTVKFFVPSLKTLASLFFGLDIFFWKRMNKWYDKKQMLETMSVWLYLFQSRWTTEMMRWSVFGITWCDLAFPQHFLVKKYFTWWRKRDEMARNT